MAAPESLDVEHFGQQRTPYLQKELLWFQSTFCCYRPKISMDFRKIALFIVFILVLWDGLAHVIF